MKTTVADEIVDWMKEKRLTHFFGIPGGGASLELINASERQGIKYVLMNHEGSASTAAAVLGDLQNTVGVCSTIMGPGALNAVFGAGLSFMERLPLFVFTDCYPENVLDKMSHQKISHVKLFESIVKKSFVMRKNEVFNVLDDAYREVFNGRPGPVHIDLPNDLLSQESQSQKSIIKEAELIKVSDSQIDAFVKALEKSQKPVFILGSGIKDPQLSALISKFIDKLKMPFLPSYRAKGMVSEDNPYYAGALFGLSNEGSFEHCVISQSDLIIQLGTDRSETPRVWGYKQASILIDYVDMKNETVAPASVKLIGDMKYILEAVVNRISERATWSSEMIASLWGQLLEKVDTSDDILTTQGIIRISRELMPRTSFATSETGVFNMMLGHLWSCYEPNTFLTPSATTTMGFSIPAVISACLYAPDRHHLAFCGDGSFHMRAGELEVLTRINAKAILVVFHDGGLGTIKIPRRDKKYTCEGLDFTNVDISKVAQGYGLKSCRVRNHKEYKDAFNQALKYDGPALIEAMVPSGSYDSFIKEIRQNMRILNETKI